MKIVVLDGFTLNPGDISWDRLKALGDLHVLERCKPEQIVDHAKDAQIILSNKVVLDQKTIAALPELRYIGVLATGYNVIDLAAAKAQSIVVSNVPGYSGPSVPQQVFALLLALTNHAEEHGQSVSQGDWANAKDFSYCLSPQVELSNLTLGVVGYGNIAKGVIAIAQAFGMKVIVSTRTVPEQPVDGVEFVDQDRLFTQSDVVSLNCPLTPQTEHMINATRLKQMKNSAFLVNTGRGPLIDEQALATALKERQIAGAGLDVLSQEPPDADNPLFSAPNCVITPHIAWATRAARLRLMDITASNIKAFQNGSPVNIVRASPVIL